MATVRQLECFVAVVECGSFTAAAERVLMTQPALSRSIRELERVVGGALLERQPRRAVLTPVGRAVLPAAQAALAEVKRVRELGRRAANLDAGELRVAAVQSLTLAALLPVVREWRRRHSGVELRLTEFASLDRLVEAMRAGAADVAVAPRPEGWTGPLRELGVEEFVVVLPAGEEGPGPGRRLDLRALSNRAWVHYEPANGLSTVVDAACAAAGFAPRVAVRTAQSSAAPASPPPAWVRLSCRQTC
ncbi:LysR family transcriptional regulator [Phytohabitans flavus]|uniref:LysR family transcriptional regulator n=1 Tax=Phytohabitans flavus TaxID=1076124 RepID=A0A6F8XLG2_9ACTN|nr:LysR family transcriptional regulator [Phytohabitans flavus]BCB74643.1 LysR family transcriptional regulator [Phytohabitans flavus]